MGRNPKRQELEWQFDSPNLGEVERWLREQEVVGNLQLRFGISEHHIDSYYDAADWRFFRAGYALRLRRAGEYAEATLKSLGATTRNGLHQRQEISEPLKDVSAPDVARAAVHAPGPVGECIRAVLGKQNLRRLFEVRTRRQRISLHIDGTPTAEIALDETTIASDQRRTPVHIQRVEVELQTDAPSEANPSLLEFVQKLRKACGLKTAKATKFELGLRSKKLQPGFTVDLGQPHTAERLNNDATVGELAFVVMREHFGQFLDREPGVRLDETTEDVHRMRVATRRLRAAMRLFRDYLPSTAEHLRDELGWVAELLGAVRDLDVQLKRLDEWRTEGEAFDPSALTDLERLLNRQRDQARGRVIHGMNSARYKQFVNAYTALLRAGAGDSPTASNRARKKMPGLIQRRYAKVREKGNAIDADSSPADYHKLRIECKRLRYALEFARAFYPKTVRKFLPRLTELQDLLGAHQDAEVAMAQMRDLSLARHDLSPQTIFTFGEISQRYAQQADELRNQFPKLYRRIKGKAWQQVERAFDNG